MKNELSWNRPIVEHNADSEINVFRVKGSSQYIVSTGSLEYSFTSAEAAEKFAHELAQKKQLFNTASLDRTGAKAADLKPERSPRPKFFPWES